MSKFFGTDGIRGIANQDLSPSLAFKCGNALTSLVYKPVVAIGMDTRKSCDMIYSSFVSGLTAGGGDAIDLGVIPTAGVAYITRELKCDFGVVISASHNAAQFNGIKIFSKEGIKLSGQMENIIEEYFSVENLVENHLLGNILDGKRYLTKYIDSIINCADNPLSGLKVVLDMSNGAAVKAAPYIFKELGAEVFCLGAEPDGLNINEGCGCLHPENILEKVRDTRADIGFAFDGDSDRLLAVGNDGRLINGDMILYLLAKDYKERGILKSNLVVGTLHTNLGIQLAMEEEGIEFVRSDIGDKFVIKLMREMGSVLGGEQSGHIIIGDKSTTGDGILAAVVLSSMIVKKGLEDLSRVKVYPQENINVIVPDKTKVLTDPRLQKRIMELQELLSGKGRILVRASGTEPKVRIMSECADEELAKETARILAEAVNKTANMEE